MMPYQIYLRYQKGKYRIRADIRSANKKIKLYPIFGQALYQLVREDRPHSISEIVVENEYLYHRLYKMC